MSRRMALLTLAYALMACESKGKLDDAGPKGVAEVLPPAPEASAPSSDAKPFAGPLLVEPKPMRFGLVLPQAAPDTVEPLLTKAIAAAFPDLPRDAPGAPARPVGGWVLEVETIPPDARPTADYLRFAGVDLSPEQVEVATKAEQVALLSLNLPREKRWEHFAAWTRLLGDLAETHDALVTDVLTGETFSAKGWKGRRRIEAGQPLVLLDHFTLHSYREGQHLRMVTLGLEKFGLPDFVVEQAPQKTARDMMHTINVMAQLAFEGATMPRPGAMGIDVKAMRDPELVKAFLGAPDVKATYKGEFNLYEGTPVEGDADNRLVEIRFDAWPGATDLERQLAFAETVWGPLSEVNNIEHDAKLEAASAKARADLMALKPKFADGVPDMNHLSVKGPFATDSGGREWMWVEVATWKDGKFEGVLTNQPHDIAALRAGQRVVVAETDIFDYVWTDEKGVEHGGTTNAIIAEMYGG